MPANNSAMWNCRTYADKLSAKVVQSLLDLLCSQLKNLLSEAGVSLLSSGSNHDNVKHDDGADSEKKDFRGEEGILWFCSKDRKLHPFLVFCLDFTLRPYSINYSQKLLHDISEFSPIYGLHGPVRIATSFK